MPVGKDVIDGARTFPLAALLGFDHRFGADRLDEGNSACRRWRHCGQARVSRSICHDAVLTQLQLVLVECETRDDIVCSPSITFMAAQRALASRARSAWSSTTCVDGVDAAVDRPSGGAEVVYLRLAPRGCASRQSACSVSSAMPSPFAALIGTTGMPSSSAQLHSTSTVPPFARTSSIIFSASTIGTCSLDHLQREIKVSLNVRGVHDVDDAVGPAVKNEIARYDLLGWNRAAANRCPAGRRPRRPLCLRIAAASCCPP